MDQKDKEDFEEALEDVTENALSSPRHTGAGTPFNSIETRSETIRATANNPNHDTINNTALKALAVRGWVVQYVEYEMGYAEFARVEDTVGDRGGVTGESEGNPETHECANCENERHIESSPTNDYVWCDDCESVTRHKRLDVQQI